MPTATEAPARLGVVVTLSARAFVAIAAIVAAAATAVAIAPGAAAHTSALLQLSFRQSPGSTQQALDILLANARVTVLPFLGALIATSRLARAACDTLLTATIGLNAILLGAALGAYGPCLAVWVPHALFELLAIAHAAGVYLAARAGRLTARTLARPALAITALLAAGAVVETYAVPL